MITSLLLASFLGNAHAVPLQITQQGRILDANGAALTGTHDLTFRIYDSASGGSVYWSETLTVNVNNGYYATVLGADEVNNILDSSTFALYPLYLELQVDSNSPMATRQAINSAPYAQMAGTAEVAESVEGGVVNATEVQINGSQVIDGSGNWVGQPISVDWNSLDPNTIPSYIADGDDNTQLSESEVEMYITNDMISLASGSQVAGQDIVTVATDSDTLAGLSCSSGEIAGWNGSAWTCVSDNTLSSSELNTLLSNTSVDLNSGSTIGGLPILTEVDDSDTLAGLNCAQDGQIAKYDLVLDQWYCADDENSPIDEPTVEGYITNGAIDLSTGSTVNGNAIVTEPSGCTDGQVMLYNLSTASWSCGTDTDTTLSASEVQAMVEAVSGLALQAGTTVGGSPVLTEASSIGPSLLDGSGGTTGQVLTTDGATVSWSDSSGGSGELTNPASLGESDGGDDFASQDTPLTIPDDNSVGITSVRYIPDSLTVDTLSIDLQMSHGDLGELSVTLTSPSGTTLTIYDGGNPGDTSFDDNIGWNVDFNSGNLYSYNGENTQGTWMLNVVDLTNGNTGTLDSWTMHFNEGWDGEMFIGGGLTVQNATEIRDDLTILDSDIVMTDQYGSEVFRIGTSAGTPLYKMAKGCLVTQSGSSSNVAGATSELLTLSSTCNTSRCYSYYSTTYYNCNANCSVSSPQTCTNTQVGNIVLYQ